MAEVMSMLSDENTAGELNADEQDSLAVGEEMEQQQETMLAGKYKNAEELEAAYIELQKKLGESSGETEESAEEETPEEPEADTSILDRLWEEAQGEEISDDLLKELQSSDPGDLAKMYLEYRNSQPVQQITNDEAKALKDSVGGEQNYGDMMRWASDNLTENEVNMYDSVMESGDRNAAYFAMQAMAYRYGDSVGVEGKLVQGKAPSESKKGFTSQAEVVAAMSDPRYDRDPAYRQEIMAKLENSNVNF
tara:strand:+ start:2740 stop:3489 length:750 start_codon:yes stop_codon:yes gene_type:complete